MGPLVIHSDAFLTVVADPGGPWEAWALTPGFEAAQMSIFGSCLIFLVFFA